MITLKRVKGSPLTHDELDDNFAGSANLFDDQTIDGVKTFLDSPIVPTPISSDNSTKVATTSFVQNAIALNSPSLEHVFNKSVILKPDSSLVGSNYNNLKIKLPFDENTDWNVYGSYGIFNVEILIVTKSDDNSPFATTYTNRMFFGGDYPGITYSENVPPINIQSLYEYNIVNGWAPGTLPTLGGGWVKQVSADNWYLELSLSTWSPIVSFKVAINYSDDIFSESLFDLAQSSYTLEHNPKVD